MVSLVYDGIPGEITQVPVSSYDSNSMLKAQVAEVIGLTIAQ
jgi:hypothetical protein